MVLDLKCSIMLVSVNDAIQPELVSGNATIKNSSGDKVLGISFESKVDFFPHLTSITKQANMKLSNLTRVQKYMAP